jgi:activator of 2-hydroxyglutaryl-CoA dehydratase
VENIVAGIHQTIAAKVTKMAKKFKVVPDVVFTGGVAKNPGVRKALEETLDCSILVPDEPLLSGALGAAILGREIVFKALATGQDMPIKERRLEAAKLFT